MSHQCHEIEFFCDGASRGNPGPSGWGAVLILDHLNVQEIGEAAHRSTNNEMEICALKGALTAALRLTSDKSCIIGHLDSKYVLDSYLKWLPGWKKSNWTKKTGEPVAHVQVP